MKTAIKPFYQRKEITKEEYKEIVRKAVEKVNNVHFMSFFLQLAIRDAPTPSVPAAPVKLRVLRV